MTQLTRHRPKGPTEKLKHAMLEMVAGHTNIGKRFDLKECCNHIGATFQDAVAALQQLQSEGLITFTEETGWVQTCVPS